jgi:chromosome segregation ATPase
MRHELDVLRSQLDAHELLEDDHRKQSRAWYAKRDERSQRGDDLEAEMEEADRKIRRTEQKLKKLDAIIDAPVLGRLRLAKSPHLPSLGAEMEHSLNKHERQYRRVSNMKTMPLIAEANVD